MLSDSLIVTGENPYLKEVEGLKERFANNFVAKINMAPLLKNSEPMPFFQCNNFEEGVPQAKNIRIC